MLITLQYMTAYQLRYLLITLNYVSVLIIEYRVFYRSNYFTSSKSIIQKRDTPKKQSLSMVHING